MVPGVRTPDDISNSFGFHPGTQDVTALYKEIRNAFESVAQFINQSCPDSRELSLAITNLEQAQMWAIKSVAVNMTPLGEEGTGWRPPSQISVLGGGS